MVTSPYLLIKAGKGSPASGNGPNASPSCRAPPGVSTPYV